MLNTSNAQYLECSIPRMLNTSNSCYQRLKSDKQLNNNDFFGIKLDLMSYICLFFLLKLRILKLEKTTVCISPNTKVTCKLFFYCPNWENRTIFGIKRYLKMVFYKKSVLFNNCLVSEFKIQK